MRWNLDICVFTLNIYSGRLHRQFFASIFAKYIEFILEHKQNFKNALNILSELYIIQMDITIWFQQMIFFCY